MDMRRPWVDIQATRKATPFPIQCHLWATRHTISIILLPQKTEHGDLSEVHRGRHLLIMTMTMIVINQLLHLRLHVHLRLRRPHPCLLL